MADEKVNIFYEKMETFEMSAEDVANLFLNYHGTQLLTDEFMQFVIDEGYALDGDEELD